MNKTVKIILGIVALISIILLVRGVSLKKEKVDTRGVIKIGAVLSLTGDFGIFGESINQGAMLAKKELEKEGYKIEYITEDDKTSATGTVNATQKLLNTDKVSAVMTATVQQVKPVQNLFINSSTPILAVWDSNDYLKSAGGNVFTIGFSTEDAGQKLANYVSEKSLNKVAVISQKDEWSELIAGAFKKQVEKNTGLITYSDSVSVSTKDFKTQILKIKESKTEAVFIPFIPGGIGVFIKQARELGYTGIILTGDSFSMSEVEYAKQYAEGVVFANLHSTETETLSKKYKEEFGLDVTDSLFVTFGYNGMKTLVKAVEKSQKENISVSDALRKVKLNGIDGLIDFQGKQYSEKVEKLYRVENGQFVEIK
jgi:branched-chain amino acid transport system substrate-binding protein